MENRNWIVEFKSRDGQSHTWFTCATKPDATRWYNDVVGKGLAARLYKERSNQKPWAKTV